MPSSLATSETKAPEASFSSAWRSLRTLRSGLCLYFIESPPSTHLGRSDSHSSWLSFRGAGHSRQHPPRRPPSGKSGSTHAQASSVSSPRLIIFPPVLEATFRPRDTTPLWSVTKPLVEPSLALCYDRPRVRPCCVEGAPRPSGSPPRRCRTLPGDGGALGKDVMR